MHEEPEDHVFNTGHTISLAFEYDPSPQWHWTCHDCDYHEIVVKEEEQVSGDVGRTVRQQPEPD